MAQATLTDNAIKVLEARYLRRDTKRRLIESPEQLFAAVARGVAHAELLLDNAAAAQFWQDQYFALIAALDFLPNTPTLMNAGKPLGQLSACFVLPVYDSMEEIFEAVKQMALVQRTGGGTGFSFSRLRPRGDIVASTAGEASGPVSFMKIFDCVTENIKQGGKRRGANMGILRADHPDIMEFVTAKREEAVLRNFNISVGATDAFMQAVRRGDRYPLRQPGTGRIVRELPARNVFNSIVDAAWRSGDPGLIFLDAINRANPTPRLGDMEATNPCGEIPLLPYESCNLGSINLSHMLRREKKRAVMDWKKLRATVHTAVRFLDDVIEVSRYPVAEIAAMTRGNRKIGLGVMGFAEMLIRLGISYDSDAAVRLAGKLMKTIAAEAVKASRQLAAQRGVFPNWQGSVYEAEGITLRNATQTAIAPTGTIGIIAGTSPSIEPLFALAYKRAHVLEGQTLLETNQLFLEYLERYDLEAERVMAEVMEKGRLQEVEGVPAELQRLFVTALDIPPERHLQIQAAFQKYVNNSVSKTINLPAAATPADVARIYLAAWEMGLKGITIYRYGSKAAQVLQLGLGEEPQQYEHTVRCDPEECRL